MPEQTRRETRRILGLICLILLCGILYAGLHPFHVPENQISWVKNANAVRFGDHGTILSSKPFPAPASGKAERSIEIWLQPGLIVDSNTILAFYPSDSPRQLSLSQSISDFAIRIQPSSAWRGAKAESLYVGDAFLDGKAALWTVTFAPSGTAVYRDGALLRISRFSPSNSEFSGQLSVGNSPIYYDSWSGILQGLAIYDTALNQTQIERHFSSWTNEKTPSIAPGDECIALYLFDEHAGSAIHNRARAGNDLYIPPKFMILHQTILDPVWRSFSWSLGFWEDALVNIVGFIPFGFFFCARFSALGLRSPALRAAVLGAGISALIELTQAKLPTRDSSMSDLICNILGAVLGASACRGALLERLDLGLSRVVRVMKGFRVQPPL